MSDLAQLIDLVDEKLSSIEVNVGFRPGASSAYELWLDYDHKCRPEFDRVFFELASEAAFQAGSWFPVLWWVQLAGNEAKSNKGYEDALRNWQTAARRQIDREAAHHA